MVQIRFIRCLTWLGGFRNHVWEVRLLSGSSRHLLAPSDGESWRVVWYLLRCYTESARLRCLFLRFLLKRCSDGALDALTQHKVVMSVLEALRDESPERWGGDRSSVQQTVSHLEDVIGAIHKAVIGKIR